MSHAQCTRCESPLEPEDLRCAICGLPVPVTQGPGPDETVASVLRCNGCGAAVAYDAEAQAPRCDFCGSVMELETPEDPIEQAEAFVRGRVSPAEARAALTAWLGSLGFFRPSDLQSSARINELKPLFWAGWMFDADVMMSWAADSDAGSQRSDWAPHSGQSAVSMRNVVVPASRGLTQDECAVLVPRYDLRGATTAPEGEWAGARVTVEQFVLQRSSARAVLSQALRSTAAAQAVTQIPGKRHRNLKIEVLPTRLSTRHLGFPAYVLAYHYRGKLYRAIVHGQDAACVTGTAPVSVGKIAAVVAAVVLLIVIVIAAVR